MAYAAVITWKVAEGRSPLPCERREEMNTLRLKRLTVFLALVVGAIALLSFVGSVGSAWIARQVARL